MQCDEAKKQHLQSMIVDGVADYFFCNKCQENQPLRYARLAHVSPLKQLWKDFEQENQVETSFADRVQEESNKLNEAWKKYHKENAILAVFCKDCEAAAPNS